jgi:DNA-repair protein XRCC1
MLSTLSSISLNAAKKEDKKRKLEITPAAKEEIKKRRVERDFPSRLSLPGETQEVQSEGPKLKKLNKPSTSKEDSSVRKEIISKNNERVSKDHGKTSLTKKKFQKFNEFLKGVHFAISGFQNPLRGEIKHKALDMGARYHGDWSSTCTHLFCAFTNTPKFNQVKGKGKIVKKEWIELCHSQPKRLPWRRFCLDKDDKNKDESEEEIFEQVDENVDCDTDEEIEKLKDEENKKKSFEKVNKTDYDCDTDEEIERVKAEENKNLTAKNACASNEEESLLRNKTESSNISKEETDKYDCETDDEEGSSNDPYDAETDIDEEEIERLLPNVSNVSYDELPSFFRGKNFYVDALFPASERKLFVRYITACGGCVLNTTQFRDIEIVISKSKKKPEEIRSWDDKTLFVKPVWLFACKDADAFLDPSEYIL